MSSVYMDDDDDPLIEEVESQCQNCQHQTGPTTCVAFPEGIPLVIMLGVYDHSQPFIENGVEKDKGLRYLPKEDPIDNPESGS